MGIKKFICCCLAVLLLTKANAQTNDTTFQKEWLHIDTMLVKQNLPKTAWEAVNELYKKAKQQQLQLHIIKCLVYRLSLEDAIFGHKPNNAIYILENEIATTKDNAAKSILYCLLANRYKQYLYNNSWYVLNKNKLQNYKPEDITTWNADAFQKAITDNFLASIAHAHLLKNIATDNFSAVVIKGNEENLKPTLYDILMYEALDYFKTGHYYITKPAYVFEVTEITALQPVEKFVTTAFQSIDTTAHKLITLKLYQQLLQFHLNDTDKNALINADMDRINWVYGHLNYNATEKEKQYLNTLETVASLPFAQAAAANYLLAVNATNKAKTYNPFGDTTYRFYYTKTLKIIDAGLQKSTEDNEAIVNLKNLKADILSNTIHTQTESINIPNQPFRALIQYKNVDTLFARIIKIDIAADTIHNYHNYPFNYLAAMPVYRTFYQPLPKTYDHQQHSVEIKIDALPTGKYVLLTSHNKAFADSLHTISRQMFDVSNISWIRNNNDFFVLNRETGKPLQNVQVKIYSEWRDEKLKKSFKILLAEKTTSENGQFTYRYDKNSYEHSSLHFITENDELYVYRKEYFYNRSYTYRNAHNKKINAEEYEADNADVFFFTDRAIYRPGQKVFFKGIVITKDFKTGNNKAYQPKDSVTVYLEDTNGDDIDSLILKVNEYGSFSGNFTIPQNVLTGSFNIYIDDYNNRYSNRKYFKVEEYKRPKFYVEFETVKGSYRINDSITVTGIAKAYAGNAIDGAKVKFNVQRNTRFIYSWYWRGGTAPRSGTEQITNGEITTDAQGKFTITFKASADENIDKKLSPLFYFNIGADVTDTNGETRSSSTNVSVGYTSLTLTLNAPAVAIADSSHKIVINANNLSNEKQNALVQVKIFPVQTPKRLIRKRYWQQPDQYIFTKEQYLQHFPYDDYANELNEYNWAALSAVFATTVNTEKDNAVTIPHAGLQAGYYKIEAVTTDKDGNEIKDIKYMQLFSNAATPFPQYNFNHAVNTYAEPGQQASFLTGSMADKIYMVQYLLTKNNAPQISIVPKNKGLHTIIYTPKEEDRGNVAFCFAYVVHNRFYSSFHTIQVPWSNKQLQVSYISYRNKTEPGNQETYTVNVKGNKGEKVAAELLTTMYDVSLDQFVTHNFYAPNIWNINQYGNAFSYQNNFTTEAATSNFSATRGKIYYIKYYDKLIKNINDVSHLAFVNIAPENSLDEVVVSVPYGTVKKKAYVGSETTVIAANIDKQQTTSVIKVLEGLVPGVQITNSGGTPGSGVSVHIRGNTSVGGSSSPLYVIDGVVYEKIDSTILVSDIENVEVLKDETATALYGSRAANGVLIITTKAATQKKKEQQAAIKPRKNFNETAFFFPNLYADTAGNYTFSFTMPESLTQWKWLSFAHTKDLAFGSNSAIITTQKTLMVQPNAPRFLREGDNMEFVAKVANLSDKELTGQCSLQLTDAAIGTSADGLFQNNFPIQHFTVAANQSTTVKFPIQVPLGFNKPLTYKIIATASSLESEAFGDGEENTLPVLTNRILVTETLPLYLKPYETNKAFSFEKLLNNKSISLTYEAVTVEYTANPVWNVIKSLPYLMEFPYECAEQTFNRVYANILAAHIVNKHPRIKQVFEKWLKDTATKSPSFGGVGEALKQILLQETPWVLQASNEQQQQKNIALLFDVVKMSNDINTYIEKLQQQQTEKGGFAWFKGGNENRYITNYILTGIGKLKKANALSPTTEKKLQPIITKALAYADEKIKEDYQWLLEHKKTELDKNNLSSAHIQYLYMRSFYDNPVQKSEAYNYYYEQSKAYWYQQNIYHAAMIGLVLYRNNEQNFVHKNILPVILENAIEDTAQGTLYWRERVTCFWYASPIEHQSMMINFLNEIQEKENFTDLDKKITAAKTWLILNKQTNNWKTTVATADACYALLNNSETLLNNQQQVQIKLGDLQLNSEKNNTEEGTGYFKQRIEGSKVTPKMGNITVNVLPPLGELKEASYGAVYWQYFEETDKITEAATSLLSLKKKLFIEKNTAKGKELQPVNENDELKVGDKIIVRIELQAGREMEFLHLKDMRASGSEPVNVLSSYKWQNGLGYYEATKDASTNFFIDKMQKGTYIFEYPLFITHAGTFSVGIATIQCMYAPEFTAHSEGIKIRVSKL